MNIRLDPVNEQGIFDNDLYMSKEYEYIYKAALKYISLEGFDEEVGVCATFGDPSPTGGACRGLQDGARGRFQSL